MLAAGASITYTAKRIFRRGKKKGSGQDEDDNDEEESDEESGKRNKSSSPGPGKRAMKRAPMRKKAMESPSLMMLPVLVAVVSSQGVQDEPRPESGVPDEVIDLNEVSPAPALGPLIPVPTPPWPFSSPRCASGEYPAAPDSEEWEDQRRSYGRTYDSSRCYDDSHHYDDRELAYRISPS